MPSPLPDALSSWREAPRVRAASPAPVRPGRYVLCWLQQALRARDNPVIDAAVRLGGSLGLPVLVYHGVREDYPYASDRLHRFLLGASRDLARGCAERGLACAQFVDRAAKREKGLVYRLAADAAAVVLEDQPAFVAQWQSERVAEKSGAPVFAVNAACLVPPAALPQEIRATSAFRRRHQEVRAAWSAGEDEVSAVPPYAGPLPYTPDRLGDASDAELDALVAACAIDHKLPPAPAYPATRAEVERRLARLQDTVLAAYAGTRNDASRDEGATGLSPYLHFGMVGPREVVAAVHNADVPEEDRRKFADELLTWREWFHYVARRLPRPERYDRVPAWARKTLDDHAGDPRRTWTLDELVHGETDDETWNAAQKQFLLEGWMHNNLRMYWGKRLVAMTPDPQTGWATACYLNDRFSLDGRDPSTYGNIAWAFGDAAPGWGERPVYGKVASRTDNSVRKKPGGPGWIAREDARPSIRVDVPERAPADPYLSGAVPI